MSASTNDLTPCEMYGAIFRRGVRYTMTKGFIHTDMGELGQNLVAVYEATMHLPENSVGRD